MNSDGPYTGVSFTSQAAAKQLGTESGARENLWRIIEGELLGGETCSLGGELSRANPVV